MSSQRSSLTDCHSDDESERTIVGTASSQRPITPNQLQLPLQSMHTREGPQTTPPLQTRDIPPRSVRPAPPHDPLQDEFPQGPSGLQSERKTPDMTSWSQGDIVQPHPVYASTSADQRLLNLDLTTSGQANALLPQAAQPRPDDVLPPPPNQPQDGYLSSLGGLPPSTHDYRLARTTHTMAQSRSSTSGMQQRFGRQVMQQAPPSAGSQRVGEQLLNAGPQSQPTTHTATTHQDELLASSRATGDQARHLERRKVLQQQIRALQTELIEHESNSTSSHRSSDFVGFEPDVRPGLDILTSTRSELNVRRDMAQTGLPTAPVPTPVVYSIPSGPPACVNTEHQQNAMHVSAVPCGEAVYPYAQHVEQPAQLCLARTGVFQVPSVHPMEHPHPAAHPMPAQPTVGCTGTNARFTANEPHMITVGPSYAPRLRANDVPHSVPTYWRPPPSAAMRYRGVDFEQAAPSRMHTATAMQTQPTIYATARTHLSPTDTPERSAAAYYVDTYQSSTAQDGRAANAPVRYDDYQSDPQRPAQIMPSHWGAVHPPNAAAFSAPIPPQTYRRVQELPQFSGVPEDWPQFICSFELTTHQYGYSDLENMGRLQRALTGEAKRRVKGILIRPEHVGKSVEILARAFGRPDVLAESQLEGIRKFPRISDNSLEEMISYSITVDSLVSLLDGPATQHFLDNYLLLKELTSKLPIADQRTWAAVARRIGPTPSIRHFEKWLAEVAADISNIKSGRSGASYSQVKPTQPKGKHVLLNLSNRPAESNVQSCTFCGEEHAIEYCESFGELSVFERLAEVRKRPLCFFCLKDDHLLPACDLKTVCGLDGCKWRHHELLHQLRVGSDGQPKSTHREEHQRQPAPKSERGRQSITSQQKITQNKQEATSVQQQSPPTDPGRTSAVLNCQAARAEEGRPKQSMFYRVVPVTIYGPKMQIETHALLDEGSSVTLIDSDLAENLELEGETDTLSLQFVSGVSSTQPSRSVKLGISGAAGDKIRYNIDAVQTAKNLSLPVQTVDRRDVVDNNPHLAQIPFATFNNVRPKLLLGLEHHFLGVPLETRTSESLHGLAAARTKLGWVLYGSFGRPTLPGAVVLHARQPDGDADDDFNRLQQLHNLVRQHFTTEDFGVKTPSVPIQSYADMRALQILEATTRRIGIRFETGLLWSRDNFSLPDSYSMALRRLSSVEAKMRRDPVYIQQYREQIESYVRKGYARKMSVAEARVRGPRTWYLPNFAVQSASKPGKFRLVFDAAATTQNVSLNSMLLAGPDLNVPLTRLLFRFRLGTVAVCADVREMFHQVAIRKSDQDAQRFLWRDGDRDTVPSTYVMTVMTFGSTCSPTAAQYAKNLNAGEFADQFPEAAHAIQRNHYVDDYVASFRSSADAQRITAEVIDVHQRGGFELRGVVSNCPAVRACFGIGADNRSVSLEPEDLTQKILGMTWETSDDTFQFQTRFHRVKPEVMDGSRRPTKREILSVAMSIFDPFGLLADFMLPSKSILQDLWRIGLQWDDPVPEQINARWQEWRSQVEATRRVRIKRCYSPSILSAPDLQLHVFADASEEAFAAVAFWRIEGDEGVELAFVAGKVRCAPLKILTIPRLELQAAVLATRLMMEIRASHEDLNISKIVLWTDSETVLKWLRCDQRRYVQFVAFRVVEVVENAPSEWWRYVPTSLNVADDATRVRTPLIFNPDSRWLHGPGWLKGEEKTWPAQPNFTDPANSAVEELRPKFVGAVSRRGAVDFGRFSKFTRLVRCVAWVRRFVANTRGRNATGELTAEDVELATETVCRLVQEESFSDEVAMLRTGNPISSQSKLFLLKPYLDEAGIMRVHGRTDAAREEIMPRTMRRPVIMPRDHHATMLIVRMHHERFAHQMTDATIASVRVKYWVPQIRCLVKSVRHACQTCRARSTKPTIPSQGQLPADRLDAYVRTFTHTGLDFFGPYHVAVGRRREKRWVALFTYACLICIRNLCHLRGVPARIRCDNGTNFVGAKNELERHPDFFDPEAIQRELAVKGVEWQFNCPGNPEAGGAWERLVQSVKRVLGVILREEAPRIETFRSLLLEAANAVNSRQLTHLQLDPDDPVPLTPNHFLVGGPNVATAPNPEDVEPTATRRQWRICRELSRRFWSQFVRDYLPELTRRNKHYPAGPQLNIGDLVVICDDQQAQRKWVRGIISDVVVAADGVVRTATVRTANGLYRRPATRLAKLDVSPSSGLDVRGAVSPIGAGMNESKCVLYQC